MSPILTPGHTVAIKSIRKKAWTKPFTVYTESTLLPGEDAYDEPFVVQSGSSINLAGDWDWSNQHSKEGTEGGMTDKADLILATDILYSGSFGLGARLMVDGIRCSIVSLNPYPDTGEIVVSAKRV